jgi:hypothetical protein
MKRLGLQIFFLMFVLEVQAYYPQVGDIASFRAQVISKEGSETDQYIWWTQIMSFGRDNGEFTYLWRKTLSNGQVESGRALSGRILWDETNDRIEHCSVHGGVEEITTVPAGTFRTCKYVYDTKFDTFTYWLGDVPIICLVKKQIVNKETGVIHREQLIEISN